MSDQQMSLIPRDLQFWKFRAYGFLKNLRFFDPFFILFLRESGLSFLAIGTLISIREIATNILEIPTGVMADAFGRRKAMLFGFSAYLIAFVLFYLGSSFWMFAIAMIAFAFGETFRSGTHKAMIIEHLRLCGCEHLNVSYYGKTRAASQFGSALASLLAAGLVIWTGSFRIIFLASTIPYILNLLLLASYPRALDGQHIALASKGWRLMEERFATAVRNLWSLLRDPCTVGDCCPARHLTLSSNRPKTIYSRLSRRKPSLCLSFFLGTGSNALRSSSAACTSSSTLLPASQVPVPEPSKLA
ncbi:MAG: MFS transporter [Candidatus Bipolaricaulota bacterium]